MQNSEGRDRDSFENKIKHYINIHRELHGSSFTWGGVVKDFMVSFPEEDRMKVFLEVERQKKLRSKKYKNYQN